MVIRKRYPRRRRFIRRRRRVYKPRIRRGLGYSAKRFFKLREIISLATPSATMDYMYITDDPKAAVGWNRLTGVFDTYRCCAVKLKFIPYVQPALANTTTITTNPVGISYQYRNAPCYVAHDYNSIISSAPDVNTMLSYSNVKVYQSYRPWKYYAKFRRNIVPSNQDQATAISLRGYISTMAPAATQTVMVLFESPFTADSAAQLIFGRVVITYYIVFKDQSTLSIAPCPTPPPPGK